MVTVELRKNDMLPDGIEAVDIVCDAQGLELLFRQLQLLSRGESHVHLMTPAWAGYELSETPISPNSILINHLQISMVGTRPESEKNVGGIGDV